MKLTLFCHLLLGFSGTWINSCHCQIVTEPLLLSYDVASQKKKERKLWLLSFCVLFIMICHLSMLTWNIELQHECWNYISLFSSSLCVSTLDKTFSIACKNYCFVTKMNRITRKESRTLTKMNVWSYNQCITSTTLWISVPKILYIYMQLSCALQIWTPFAYNFIWSTLFFLLYNHNLFTYSLY